MSSLQKNSFLRSVQFYLPTLILIFSVLNEFDLKDIDLEHEFEVL